jgi:hypothetical protein
MLVVSYMNDIAYQFRMPKALHLKAKAKAESEGMVLSTWVRRLIIAATEEPKPSMEQVAVVPETRPPFNAYTR